VLLNYLAPADVLFDRVQFGFDMQFPAVPASGAGGFCAALARAGLLARRPPRGGAALGPHTVGPFEVRLAAGGVGRVEGRIVLASDGAGRLVATRRSHLVVNPMRDLRTQLEAPGARALDGNDNLVWEYGEEWAHLLGLQLANVATVVDAFFAVAAAAAAAAPQAPPGRIWVQHCEVCRDHASTDAEAVVLDLAERPIPRAGLARLRTLDVRERNLQCVAWRERSKAAPEHKVYAKRADLLRVEVAARSRDAVRALLKRRTDGGPASAPLEGAAAARLLADAAVAAAPLLDAMVAMIDDAAGAQPRAGRDLLLGFAPLIRLAEPAARAPGAGGRRPGASVAANARRAICKLLDFGSFDARGIRDSDAVLGALREMVDRGVLSRPERGQRLFTVSPGLEAARRALSSARTGGD
jgi:hypothetical protein